MFLATIADSKTTASWGEGQKTQIARPDSGFGWVLIGWVLGHSLMLIVRCPRPPQCSELITGADPFQELRWSPLPLKLDVCLCCELLQARDLLCPQKCLQMGALVIYHLLNVFGLGCQASH